MCWGGVITGEKLDGAKGMRGGFQKLMGTLI